MFTLNKESNNSYKIGVDEIQDLKSTMLDLMKPIQKILKDKIYYSDVELSDAEYKSRDGFLPHASNLGGIQIFEVIPKCEEYSFNFLTFGDYQCDEYCTEDECTCDDDGGLSASLQLFFKLESFDPATGECSFYICLHGGNNDAPYFRKSEDIFEAEFTASNKTDLQKKMQKPIQDLIKLIK